MTDDAGPRPMAWWDDLLADRDARAEEYAADGWEVCRLHPGDVTALDGRYGERAGLSILLPDDEFEAIETVLGAESVTGYEAYRTEVQGYVAFLVAVETDEGTAILCPGYYSLGDPAVYGMFDQARAAGYLTFYLRRLDETSVELTLENPGLLAPDVD